MSNKPYKVAITVGCFDMLHEGHVNLFKKMHKYADRLFVLVHDDDTIYVNKDRFPVQDIVHRIENLRKVGFLEPFDIEKIITVRHSDPSFRIKTLIDTLKVSGKRCKEDEIVYMRGDDWKDFPGREMVEKLGIDIKFVPYTEGVSSSQRRNKAQL